MKKSAAIIFTAIILLMCAAPLLLTLAGVRTPSAEKRMMSAAPSFLTADGSMNKSFTADLDSYIADNFPLRPWLISAWHQLNISVLGQTGNSQVILGRDGWLFFAETVPAYLGQDQLSDAEYERLDTLLRLQSEYLASQGKKLLYTVVPNKNTVYPNHMPDRYSDRTDDNALAGLAGHLTTPGYIDLRSLLTSFAANSSELIYHKTDTHWNNRGAVLTLTAILSQAGEALDENLSSAWPEAACTETADWQGDLAVMLFPSGPSPDFQQTYDIQPVFRYTRPLRSLEDLLITTQGSGSDLSLLMFRDSFANALIPMLSDSFGHATYSRAVPYDYSLPTAADADLVLLEIVERNLGIWLTSPPKMPAPVFSGPLPAAENDAGNLVAEASADGQLTRISGQVTGGGLTDRWTRVLAVLDGKTYEAFPVTDTEAPDTAGFVFYLSPEGSYPTDISGMQVYVQNGDSWIRAGG